FPYTTLFRSDSARGAFRVISSFAPGCDGGSPSSLITVASTTSSPCASRAASSSSTLGTSGSLRENGLQDRCRGRDVFVGGVVTGGQAQAAQRLLQAQAHREQDV